MNLHGLAVGLVGMVNANQDITHKKYNGVSQNSYFEQTPSYTESTIKAQVQALSSDQLQAVNNLNLQGEMYSVITAVALRGSSKPDQQGGDLLFFEGYDWLVVHVDETFSDHCKAVIQKQS